MPRIKKISSRSKKQTSEEFSKKLSKLGVKKRNTIIVVFGMGCLLLLALVGANGFLNKSAEYRSLAKVDTFQDKLQDACAKDEKKGASIGKCTGGDYNTDTITGSFDITNAKCCMGGKGNYKIACKFNQVLVDTSNPKPGVVLTENAKKECKDIPKGTINCGCAPVNQGKCMDWTPTGTAPIGAVACTMVDTTTGGYSGLKFCCSKGYDLANGACVKSSATITPVSNFCGVAGSGTSGSGTTGSGVGSSGTGSSGTGSLGTGTSGTGSSGSSGVGSRGAVGSGSVGTRPVGTTGNNAPVGTTGSLSNIGTTMGFEIKSIVRNVDGTITINGKTYKPVVLPENSPRNKPGTLEQLIKMLGRKVTPIQ